MAGILELMGHVQQQGEIGRARGKQTRLASLVGQAFEAPREQRQPIFGQIAQVDPQSAFDAEKGFRSMDDSARAQLGQTLAAFDTLPDEQKAQAYPQIAQQARSMLGLPVPMEWNPAMAPNIQKLAQALGGGASDDLKSVRIGEDGFYYAIRGGQMVNTGVRADPRMKVMEAAGGIVGVNERTLQANPVTMGQHGGGEVPFTIDPSLPPEIQADIRRTEAQGQPWTQAPQQLPPPLNYQGGGQLQAAPPKVSPVQMAQLGLSQQSGQRDEERLRLAQEAAAREAALGGMTPTQAFKLQQSRRKESAMLSSGEAKIDETIKLIDGILGKKGDFSGITGMGAFGARIPGTDWADLANKLETLKARSAFGSLQEMRANSPTGGALGSVTERELSLLQNAETQLGSSQSPESLEAALTDYKRILNDSKRRMRAGFEEFYQQTPADTAPSNAVQPSGRLKFNPATGRIE